MLLRIAIWAFFLLIPTKMVEYLTFMHLSPVRPFEVYGFLTAASLALVGWQFTRERAQISYMDSAIFLPQLALVAWFFLRSGSHEGGAIFWTWPLTNVLMGASIVYFCRSENGQKTITAAVATALVVQLAAIYADLWFPGIFAEWVARPAGLPQNPNNATFLIACLASILLPSSLGANYNHRVTNILFACAPLIAVTVSKSGMILYLIVCVIFIVSLSKIKRDRAAGIWIGPVKFMAILVPVTLVTLLFSPLSHHPQAIAVWQSRLGITPQAPTLAAPSPRKTKESAQVSRSDTQAANKSESAAAEPVSPPPEKVLSQAEISRLITESDNTTEVRMAALKRFLTIGLEHPVLGQGTGYSNLFNPGPHNMYVALLVDGGAPAVIFYLLFLGAVTYVAFIRRSPALAALAAVGWIGSMFSHTVVVDPVFFPCVAAAYALAISPLSAAQQGVRAHAQIHAPRWVIRFAVLASLCALLLTALGLLLNDLPDPIDGYPTVTMIMLGCELSLLLVIDYAIDRRGSILSALYRPSGY
jgi:hypothetical protein